VLRIGRFGVISWLLRPPRMLLVSRFAVRRETAAGC